MIKKLHPDVDWSYYSRGWGEFSVDVAMRFDAHLKHMKLFKESGMEKNFGTLISPWYENVGEHSIVGGGRIQELTPLQVPLQGKRYE